jgi:hypothetical protein
MAEIRGRALESSNTIAPNAHAAPKAKVDHALTVDHSTLPTTEARTRPTLMTVRRRT